MKRILPLLLCFSCVAAFAQGPGALPGGNRSAGVRGKKKNTGVEAERRAEIQTEDGGAEAVENNANQENFDEMMDSFSELAMKFSQKDTSNLDVLVYECRHISAEAFARALEPFLSVNGEISDCEDADLVVISDDVDRLEQLKKIAESIDRPVRQVLVSASVVEFQITDGFEKDLSAQYNQFVNFSQLQALPGGADPSKVLASGFSSRMLDAILPSGGNPASQSGSSSYLYYDPDEQAIFSAFLTYLETKGKAEILSSPSLVMRRGHTGNILSGEDIPITESNVGSGGTSFSIEYKSVGIKLRVTPQSIFEDRVVLEVSPEVSNIIRYEESQAGRNPVVAIRNASTMLEINDGNMVSIGGLLREEKIETVRRVPILGSVPLLGTLFRATDSEKIRSQLVIFLTVNVVDPVDLSADTVKPRISDELQQQIDQSRNVMPVEKRSLFRDIWNLFK